jgi:pimeloyl-ACP methyl ester carboxylesterase
MAEAMTEMWISTEAGELEAGWWGPSADAAPTIVLLHEGLGCVRLWRDLPAWLAEATGFGVFAYSRLGYGRSARNPAPWPLDYMRGEATIVLPRVLEAAGIRRFLLVGHSDGASIAVIHAAGNGDARLAGLVLIAPHFFPEPVALTAIAEAREDYQSGDLRTKLARYHEHVDDAFWGWNRAWLDPEFAAFDLKDDLAAVRQPTLVMQGEDDPYGTCAQPETAVRLVPGPVERLMVPAARHAPHLEAPEKVRPAIAGFAARVLAA